MSVCVISRLSYDISTKGISFHVIDLTVTAGGGGDGGWIRQLFCQASVRCPRLRFRSYIFKYKIYSGTFKANSGQFPGDLETSLAMFLASKTGIL